MYLRRRQVLCTALHQALTVEAMAAGEQVERPAQ